MKRIFQCLFILIVIMSLSSCYTTEKFVVSGKVGTEIYTPDGERLSVIENDGLAKVMLPSDECYTYLLAKENRSNLYVPFALDYRNKSYVGTKTLSALAYAIIGAGLVGEIAGLAALLGGDEDIATPFLLAGGGGLLVGGFCGLVTNSRLGQTSHEWQFTYLKQQQTNSDIHFTQPVYTEPAKKLVPSESSFWESTYDGVTNAGWNQKRNKTVNLPFKSGSFDVIQVVTHFNGNSIKMEPEGKVTIEGNVIHVNIPGNSYLEDKTIRIIKDLKRNRRFGDPERTYDLYETSNEQEIGVYFDDSFESIGVLEQKILIPINESAMFEIAWM